MAVFIADTGGTTASAKTPSSHSDAASISDRQQAAVHEAGHLTLAAHFGVPANVTIWRLQPTVEGLPIWSGKVEYQLDSYRRLAMYRRAMICVAGLVAEHAWKASEATGILKHPWEEILRDPNCMSETDWAGAGVIQKTNGGVDLLRPLRACERVAVLLDPQSGSLWQSLCKNTETLILPLPD